MGFFFCFWEKIRLEYTYKLLKGVQLVHFLMWNVYKCDSDIRGMPEAIGWCIFHYNGAVITVISSGILHNVGRTISATICCIF